MMREYAIIRDSKVKEKKINVKKQPTTEVEDKFDVANDDLTNEFTIL